MGRKLPTTFPEGHKAWATNRWLLAATTRDFDRAALGGPVAFVLFGPTGRYASDGHRMHWIQDAAGPEHPVAEDVRWLMSRGKLERAERCSDDDVRKAYDGARTVATFGVKGDITLRTVAASEVKATIATARGVVKARPGAKRTDIAIVRLFDGPGVQAQYLEDALGDAVTVTIATSTDAYEPIRISWQKEIDGHAVVDYLALVMPHKGDPHATLDAPEVAAVAAPRDGARKPRGAARKAAVTAQPAAPLMTDAEVDAAAGKCDGSTITGSMDTGFQVTGPDGEDLGPADTMIAAARIAFRAAEARVEARDRVRHFWCGRCHRRACAPLGTAGKICPACQPACATIAAAA